MATNGSRGQTSMEFTIILAIVLVVGLVVIGLALYFVSGSSDVNESESRAYWSTQMRPLRIVDMAGYYYSASPGRGEVALKFENVESKPITLKGLVMEKYTGTGEAFDAYQTHSADGSDGTLFDTSTPADPLWTNGIKLSPNEQTVIYVRATTLCSNLGSSDASTERFKNLLTIYYETPDFTGLSVKGIKPIVGKCAPA